MAQSPVKPPRASTEGEEGRTLWQISWNGDQEEPVVSMVDISRVDLSTGSDFRPHAAVDEESGDIVVFERNAQELEGKIKAGPSIYKKFHHGKKGEEDFQEEVDLSDRSLEGWKYVVRGLSDSALDLVPPGSGATERWARARWCCLSCRTATFWKHYWYVPTLILLAVTVYVCVTLFIVKALLDASV